MDVATTPKFDYLDKFPREIRDIVFGYMVQDTIASHLRPFNCDTPVWTRNEFHTDGFDTPDAKAHLTNSPLVTLNKQYCTEYLEAFVREVELRAYFRRHWEGGCLGSGAIYQDYEEYGGLEPMDNSRGSEGVTALKDSLKLISTQHKIASLHIGNGTSKKPLLSHIKAISLSYHYNGSFFDPGVMGLDLRVSPPEDYLRRSMKLLRRCHEEYKVPCDRLSIHISYGDPAWTFQATLDV